ncbi:hypothetical protein LMG33818_002618 [Halomonadaceae bacterium LMG 33818]|uniref:tail fiber protein n=1 Tax=Cernens ardua TaxID=3402176 RepID=UPI003EDBA207
MAITFIITDKGKEAVKDGLSAGNTPQISAVGFGSSGYTASASQTSLQQEIKRLTTVSGQAASSNMLHVTVQDESTDTYTVKEIGVYLADGTLFAVYSQTDEIIEKAAAALVMLAIDIAVDDIDATKLSFGDAAFVDPPATTSTRGIVMLNDSVASTATDQAATANAVKQANDNANTRETPAGAQAKVNAHADANTAHNAGQISVNPPWPFSGMNSVQAMLGALGSAARLNSGTGNNDVVQGSRKINAGNGLTGGGNLTGDRTLSLATPQKLDWYSSNEANENGHSHELQKASTSDAGIVQLVDDTKSTYTDRAATANAVKQANDNANLRETPQGAQDKVNAHANASTAHNAGQISVNPPSAFSGQNSVQAVISALGSAAGMNAGTQAGQVMPVGAFGIGGTASTLDPNQYIQNITQSGLYYADTHPPKDWPGDAANWGLLFVNYHSSANASYVVIDINNNVFTNSTSNGKMNVWKQLVARTDLAAVAFSGSWADLLNKPAKLNALSIGSNGSAALTGGYGDSIEILGGTVLQTKNSSGQVTLRFDGSEMTVGNVPLDRIPDAGTAAAANVGTDSGDVMPVGAFGWGGNNLPALQNMKVSDVWKQPTGLYTYDPSCTGQPSNGYGVILNLSDFNHNDMLAFDTQGVYYNTRWASGRSDNSTAFSGWQTVYTSASTIPVSNGGTGANDVTTARNNLGLSTLAATGQWGDLEGKPDQATRWPKWSEVDGKPTFANVAFSGKWADISGAPVQTTRWPKYSEVTDTPTLGNAASRNVANLDKAPNNYTDWEGNFNDLPVVGDIYTCFMSLAAIARSGKWEDIQGIPDILRHLSFSGDDSVRYTAPSGDILQIEANNQLKMIDAAGTLNLNFEGGVMTVGTIPVAHVSGLAGVATSGQLSADNVTGLNAWLGGMNAGDVGSYALLRRNDGNYHYAGDVVAGSALNYASAGEFESDGTAPGNWRAMGQTNNHGGADGDEVTLFLRVN